MNKLINAEISHWLFNKLRKYTSIFKLEKTKGTSSLLNAVLWYWVKYKAKCYERFKHKKNFIDALIWVSNSRLRFSCDFLTNLGNVPPFITRIKQKERNCCEIHFFWYWVKYKAKSYERLNHKNNFMNAVIVVTNTGIWFSCEFEQTSDIYLHL